MSVCAQTACSIRELRDAINILEARIADQDTEIAALRRRIAALEHGRESAQAAVNAQAAAIERLEAREP